MKLARVLVVVVGFASLIACAGCNQKGACIQTVPGAGEMCNELSQSVCKQGKGDRFVGGTCKSAGFTKKSASGYWDK
jgi:hypothetical protein